MTRSQMTVYLRSETKNWLKKYARQMNLKESEIVRCLIERERQVEWFQWALKQPDPNRRGRQSKLKKQKGALPPRCIGD